MEALKDATPLFECERLIHYGERPGFQITEIQILPSQQVPWHYHNKVQDTFYVIEARLRIFLREPQEEVSLGPGETYSVRPRRHHLVTTSAAARQPFSFSNRVSLISSRSPRILPP